MEPEPQETRYGAESFMTVREMVIEIRSDLKTLSATVANKTQINDHETRLRGLERWKYGIPPTAVVAIGGLVAAFIR